MDRWGGERTCQANGRLLRLRRANTIARTVHGLTAERRSRSSRNEGQSILLGILGFSSWFNSFQNKPAPKRRVGDSRSGRAGKTVKQNSQHNCLGQSWVVHLKKVGVKRRAAGHQTQIAAYRVQPREDFGLWEESRARGI